MGYNYFNKTLYIVEGSNGDSIKKARAFLDLIEQDFRKHSRGRNLKADLILSFPPKTEQTEVLIRYSQGDLDDMKVVFEFCKIKERPGE